MSTQPIPRGTARRALVAPCTLWQYLKALKTHMAFHPSLFCSSRRPSLSWTRTVRACPPPEPSCSG